jgi:hypothetical protein
MWRFRHFRRPGFACSRTGNWSWPRYGFANKSDDIKGIFCYACDRFGVHWTAAGKKQIYVSRKADVARLDEFIGPKR